MFPNCTNDYCSQCIIPSKVQSASNISTQDPDYCLRVCKTCVNTKQITSLISFPLGSRENKLQTQHLTYYHLLICKTNLLAISCLFKHQAVMDL